MILVLQVYPPPPPWFKLYRSDADGSAERPFPPEPPIPPTGDFQVFGRMESVSLDLVSQGRHQNLNPLFRTYAIQLLK